MILAVGATWQVSFEIYAHIAAGRAARLADDALASLSVAKAALDLSPAEQVAWRFARQLSAERRVDNDLYAEVVSFFDERALVDLVMLVGSYLFTSAVLNAFEVPAPRDDRRGEA